MFYMVSSSVTLFQKTRLVGQQSMLTEKTKLEIIIEVNAFYADHLSLERKIEFGEMIIVYLLMKEKFLTAPSMTCA